MQSDMGHEWASGFFLLDGLCVVWGLASLRGPMLLSLTTSLLWACAVGLYMGRLELNVELVPEDMGRPLLKTRMKQASHHLSEQPGHGDRDVKT